jgi:hypothetical protein
MTNRRLDRTTCEEVQLPSPVSPAGPLVTSGDALTTSAELEVLVA